MTPPFLAPAAKAVAAFLGPYVAVLLAWLAAKGLDFDLDPSWVETTVASVLTAVWVYFKKNKPTPTPVPEDVRAN